MSDTDHWLLPHKGKENIMASIAIWKIVLVFALVFAAGFLDGRATSGKGGNYNRPPQVTITEMEPAVTITNCFIEPKDGGIPGMNTPGPLILDGYAIVPWDRYQCLVDEIERLRKREPNEA